MLNLSLNDTMLYDQLVVLLHNGNTRQPVQQTVYTSRHLGVATTKCLLSDVAHANNYARDHLHNLQV